MMTGSIRRWRIFCALPALLLAACGGGSGGDGGGNNTGNVSCSGSGSVTVSGSVRYEFVPAVPTSTAARLDFANSSFRPVRGATIAARCADGSTEFATGVTDENGEFALEVPHNVDVVIRARAEMKQSGTPGWNVRVVDNTEGQGVWAVQGEAFNSGTSDVSVNLRAESGWNGSAYTESRSAAPFAILDSVYTAMQQVLAADPDAVFPELKLNWSPANTSTCDGTTYPYEDGCIGTSFFANFGSAGRNIFILGDAGEDTDEFDNHVVIHEWGHYYEDAFARSDSIGGAHGGEDALDMRVAFGEGWGNAWSGIATNDPLYVDTFGTGARGFYFDVEDDFEGGNPGWWNESSVQEILFDLWDGADDDGVDLGGFAPLHDVLTSDQRGTAAMTSIFSLVHYLKQSVEPVQQDAIDDLLAAHDIALVSNEWGDGRDSGILLGGNGDDGSEFGNAGAISPVHQEIAGTVTDGMAVNGICTTNALASTDEYNRLGARRFLRFAVSSSGDWRIRLEDDGSMGADSDPDFFVYRNGVEVTDGTRQGVAASGVDNSASDGDGAGQGVETATVPLSAGEQYVIEVVEYLNVDSDDSTGGDVCLNLSFEQL